MPFSSDHPHVVIIGAGLLVAGAYRLARDTLGLGTIGVDRNAEALAEVAADVPVVVSTKDEDAVVSAITDLARSVHIIGVFTCGADVEITVAAVAKALNVPGIPVDVARRCNDKLAMHRFLDAAGFAAKPRWAFATTPTDACDAVREIGLPCVVKPIDNCASRGVQIIEDPALMEDAFDLACGFNLGASGVLIEQALRGSKHTVEMITDGTDWHLLSIIDTHYISPRWPCETGLETTRLAPEDQARLFAFAQDVARLVGIDYNAHKVDVNLAEDGTIGLIELTARLSGGFHCQYVSPLAYGSNDILAALKMACGMGLDREAVHHRREDAAAVRAAFPPPGRLTRVDIDSALAVPGVRHVFAMRHKGDMVGPYRNSADRPVFVIATGTDVDAAVKAAEAGVVALALETEPVGADAV